MQSTRKLKLKSLEGELKKFIQNRSFKEPTNQKIIN